MPSWPAARGSGVGVAIIDSGISPSSDFDLIAGSGPGVEISYVDARDVAQSTRLALTADITGAEAFIIAAGDTVMNRPNAELMAEYFPSVPIREGTGEHDTLLSIGKARRLLGYAPAWSWRDILAVPASTAPPHEERRR